MPATSGAIGPLRGRRLHLVGMAGRGLAPLAIVSEFLGADVTGCDVGGPPTQRAALSAAGIAIAAGHDPDHVLSSDAVVATSIATGPEVDAARSRGVLFHRTDLLAQVLRERPGIGVTGSHGKGTVTALTSAALESAGLDPLAVIGAYVPALGGVARLGHGPTVAEVDDSDLTLARVESRIAVVTNADEDHPHLPYSLTDVLGAMAEFAGNASDRVILGRSKRLRRVAAAARSGTWVLGRDIQVRVLSTDASATRLRLVGPGGERAVARVPLMGAAVADNAALAFGAALAAGADAEAAAEGLSRIDRIERRLEPVGERNGVLVIDDFGGKHPVNVREGLRAIRRRFPDAAVTAVFEPYGPYLSRWAHRYARALGHADRVVILPPATLPHYSAGGEVLPGWWRSCPLPVIYVGSQQEAVSVAMSESRPGDVVAFFAQVNASRTMALTAAGRGPGPAS